MKDGVLIVIQTTTAIQIGRNTTSRIYKFIEGCLTLSVPGHNGLRVVKSSKGILKKKQGKMKQKTNVLIAQTPKPEAWVSVSNNRQKVYGESKKIVYLDDDQEFEIELYNPTQVPYLVKIQMNGSSISRTGLVIKPGQRYYLDRFIDEKRKLVFSTYSVDDSKETEKAIALNGLVTIEFYPEQPPTYYSSGYAWIDTTRNNWGNYGGSYSTIPNIYTSNVSNSSPVFGKNTSISSIGPSSYFLNSASLSAGASFTTTSTANLSDTKSIETGRIEKGEVSKQEFGNDYGHYSYLPTTKCEYQLMPRSTKPVEVAEIRNYCSECKTRIKKKTWKFCPSCGESLD